MMPSWMRQVGHLLLGFWHLQRVEFWLYSGTTMTRGISIAGDLGRVLTEVSGSQMQPTAHGHLGRLRLAAGKLQASGAEQAGPEYGALARRVMVRFVNREGPPAMDPGFEERALQQPRFRCAGRLFVGRACRVGREDG